MDKFKLFNLFYNYKINELPKLEFSENQSSFKDIEDMNFDKKNKLNSFFEIQKKMNL